MKRFVLGFAVLVLLLAGGFLAVDYSYPLPGFQQPQTTLVVTADGTPMRVIGVGGGPWSYPVHPGEVSRWYRQALISSQDPGFFHHPGIEPLRLLHAAWHRTTGRGAAVQASLTMRVAQMMTRYRRGFWGDIRILFRTAQLELHYSKQHILTLYFNHAPFGGPLRGVQAASYAYFHKPASALDQAEAALLVALPSQPSKLRPDRHPAAARQARDKVLTTLQEQDAWTGYAVKQALQEPVPMHMDAHPQLAPLLARRMARQAAGGHGVIHTTIESGLQRNLQLLAGQAVSALPPATSAAILVMDNRTLAVKAYVGSGAYPQRDRFGYVDMVTPRRPIGGVLDSFLYGFALDAGLIDSGSLLADVPRAFGNYIPTQPDADYRGPVSAAQALQSGSAVPATQVLKHFGGPLMLSRLRQALINVKLLNGTTPDLTLIRDGMGASLQQLVRAYSALGRAGMAGQPRLKPDTPATQHRLLSPGAAWIVRKLLSERPAPKGLTRLPKGHELAWASGGSAGERDRWAVGVSGHYTVGVWVGRPDGTGVPTYYKKPYSAVPLLFDAAAALPDLGGWQAKAEQPENVAKTTVCWPLGGPPKGDDDPLCDRRVPAWTLDGKTPPTLKVDGAQRQAGVQHFQINAGNGKRVTRACKVAHRAGRTVAQWPITVEPWLPPRLRLSNRLPAWDPSCPAKVRSQQPGLRITDAPASGILKAPSGQNAAYLSLGTGNDGNIVFWLINGHLARTTGPFEAFSYRVDKSGSYRVTAIDSHGAYDEVTIKVEISP